MEHLIAYHCGPAMAGIKVSNIVSCYKDKIKNIKEEVERLNTSMNKKDIYFKILCECEKRAMIIVYRKALLEEHLNKKEIREFLYKYNYPEKVDLESYFDILKERLKEKDFPHEIGVFLGYPLWDIEGFINNKEGFLLNGEWKVYDKVEETQKLFSRFEKCRRGLMRRICMGDSLSRVFCA